MIGSLPIYPFYFLRYIKFKFLIMIKKEDNIRSESYYPDSNYYVDQDNTFEGTRLSEDKISNTSKFEWPNSYWFIAERTNGRLAMIGFMAVIINYTLFGWIAYPIL